MKLPLKVIKFIFKRELKIIILECERRSNTCNFTAMMSKTDNDIHYLKGKVSAYNEIVNYLENEIIKIG